MTGARDQFFLFPAIAAKSVHGGLILIHSKVLHPEYICEQPVRQFLCHMEGLSTPKAGEMQTMAAGFRRHITIPGFLAVLRDGLQDKPRFSERCQIPVNGAQPDFHLISVIKHITKLACSNGHVGMF